MHRLFFSISLVLLWGTSEGQTDTCTCQEHFQWAKETFEQNDAGFAYALENKGELAYQLHNESIQEKIKAASTLSECTQTIYEWMTFFRKGHIGIQVNNSGTSQNSNSDSPSDSAIIAQFSDWEHHDLDLENFKKHLDSKDDLDYEGIWISGVYKIAIKKIGAQYIGTIVEADGVYWRKGQVKLKINDDGTSTFYMRDHSSQSFDKAEMLGKSHLEMGFVNLQRAYPETEPDENVERYFALMDADGPYVQGLDSQTMIPVLQT